MLIDYGMALGFKQEGSVQMVKLGLTKFFH